MWSRLCSSVKQAANTESPPERKRKLFNLQQHTIAAKYNSIITINRNNICWFKITCMVN